MKVNMKKKTRKGKIINLSDHDKLINLISIHNEKDVNYLLQSVDQVFFEVFNIKKKDLPWQSQNSEDEWNNTLRKVRLGIFKLYFEYQLGHLFRAYHLYFSENLKSCRLIR